MSERAKGATSVSLQFRLTDVTTGAAKTGLDVTTLKLQYSRAGEVPSTATALTLLASETAAFTAFGAIQVDATNSPGIYRVDAPDAAFAGTPDEVTLTVNGSAIQPVSRLIDLTTINLRAASVPSDVQTVKTQPVTCTAPVTVLASLGTAAASTAQTGDSFALVGTAGAGLTAIGDARLAKLDANVSTRSTYAGGDTPGTATLLGRVPNFPANFAALSVDATTGGVVVKTNADKTGYALSQGFPTNFSSLSIDATTGGIVVKTNNDKAGYSLSQAFPTNFAALTIDATTGGVVVKTNNDKAGYSISQPFPANFAALAIDATTGGVVVKTNNDKAGYALSATQAYNNTAQTNGLPSDLKTVNGIANYNGISWSDIFLYAAGATVGVTQGIAPGSLQAKVFKPGDLNTAAHYATIVFGQTGDRATVTLS